MSRRRTPERGSVTAELAVTLPALTGILALLLVCVVIGVTQLRLEEAAWAGARAAARGETAAAAASTARRIAGPAAEVDVSTEGDWSRVRVSAHVEGPLSGLVQWPIVAEAMAQRSPYSPGPSSLPVTPTGVTGDAGTIWISARCYPEEPRCGLRDQ
ncbi:TadE family type IV pilus minor pilin [Arthrobacter monumenti]